MELKPIKINPSLEKETEKKIIEFIEQEIFLPVVKVMEESKQFFNSSNAIESAIRSGKIQFSDGIFKGDFNAKLTKEFRALGLKYDSRIKGYRKELNNLPVNLQVAIAQTKSTYEKMASNMIKAIDNLNPNYEKLSFVSDYDFALADIDKGFTKTVSEVIGVQVEVTPAQRQLIVSRYSENMKLYIKDFVKEQIPVLRQDVEKAVFSGIRAKSLQDTIVARYGVSESKAKFLAKQEISLLTSNYKQAKYEEAGIRKYKWSISNVRTRPDHRALNGKIFSFDNPPITNRDKGTKNNPGEDYGCNCVAIPIIE